MYRFHIMPYIGILRLSKMRQLGCERLRFSRSPWRAPRGRAVPPSRVGRSLPFDLPSNAVGCQLFDWRRLLLEPGGLASRGFSKVALSCSAPSLIGLHREDPLRKGLPRKAFRMRWLAPHRPAQGRDGPDVLGGRWAGPRRRDPQPPQLVLGAATPELGHQKYAQAYTCAAIIGRSPTSCGEMLALVLFRILIASGPL